MSPLERYIAFMESVETFDLDHLDDFIAQDIHFVDPFNDTIGRASYRRIIEDMRHQMANLKIKIISSAVVQVADNVDIKAAPHQALIRWHLSGNLKSFKNRFWQVEGCSAVSFDEYGNVCEHLDYWDAAGQLYESFPVIGSLLRYVRRKLATD